MQSARKYLPGRVASIQGDTMSKRLKRLSHTVYECKYHIVFCPKYRFKVLTGNIAQYVHGELYCLCRQKDDLK